MKNHNSLLTNKELNLIDNQLDEFYYSHGGNNKLNPYNINDNIMYNRTYNNYPFGYISTQGNFTQDFYENNNITNNIIDDIYNNINENNNININQNKKINNEKNQIENFEIIDLKDKLKKHKNNDNDLLFALIIIGVLIIILINKK